MTRTTAWIVAHQAEVAAAFEAYELRPGDEQDPQLIRAGAR
ncbi:hypothetical protein [Mycolicibacter senuensis]|nr:hypothetical protein [Mycolicibacter senuensis]